MYLGRLFLLSILNVSLVPLNVFHLNSTLSDTTITVPVFFWLEFA